MTAISTKWAQIRFKTDGIDMYGYTGVKQGCCEAAALLVFHITIAIIKQCTYTTIIVSYIDLSWYSSSTCVKVHTDSNLATLETKIAQNHAKRILV